MTRRSILATAAGAVLAGQTRVVQAAPAGRLKQSAARWCYAKMSLDDLCSKGAQIGLSGIDLVNHTDWPTVRKYGLTPAMTPGAGTIANAWNRKENHEQLIREMHENLERASAAKVPNVITFSGNRKGMADDEAKDNCVAGLNQVKKIAEDNGVTICLELLNSKVDHKDYQCDHTAWGVDVVKRVGSPRVKLLYDIYHMQIMEGDVIRTIRAYKDYIGHYHTGGNPGRNEIDETQELNYRAIAKAIVATGYKGYLGQEFLPKRDAAASLKQAFETCDV
jgi:hydroxypyruvate isomerase